NGKDCCLSPIVQADYIQIPAPRATSLEFKKGKNVIQVAITGSVSNVVFEADPDKQIFYYHQNQIEIIIEPLTIQPELGIHVSVDEKPIEHYKYVLEQSDIKNYTFFHTKEFILNYDKPYRIKILEYEVMQADNKKKNLAANPVLQRKQRRLIFSDVYEVT
ncbi:MAG: hypothetical protein N2747_01225, partial [Chitinophagaceae bacterium]|nr:hypothetical protein [Chitinophagaceae bacterium]